MDYLAIQLWPYLTAAFIVGFITGWKTSAQAPMSKGQAHD